ncbi:hypothetical protein MD484_g934, partial [Candolleomyces efflorescens]
MKAAILTILAFFALSAQAHFRLLYPEPRGVFVADREPLFCGGYDNVTTNRTTFPLSNGFFRIRQGHEDWAASVLISVAPNPNTFDAFSAGGQFQFARLWANESKTGNFCIPLDLSSTGVAGVEDGANVTIQVVLTGGDGELYQCADLTLSSNFTPPADLQATCTNQTADDSHSSHGTSTSTSPSSTAGSTAGSGSLGNAEHLPLFAALAAGVFGALLGLL